MNKSFEKYGTLRFIDDEDWCHLNWNPYRFLEDWARADDGTICEIFSCGNAAKKFGIPQYVATRA